jgi:hypothetical protein
MYHSHHPFGFGRGKQLQITHTQEIIPCNTTLQALPDALVKTGLVFIDDVPENLLRARL